jgi:hypothetical protein
VSLSSVSISLCTYRVASTGYRVYVIARYFIVIRRRGVVRGLRRLARPRATSSKYLERRQHGSARIRVKLYVVIRNAVLTGGNGCRLPPTRLQWTVSQECRASSRGYRQNEWRSECPRGFVTATNRYHRPVSRLAHFKQAQLRAGIFNPCGLRRYAGSSMGMQYMASARDIGRHNVAILLLFARKK